MVKWILLGLLALPVAEIAVFILVAATIGLFQALAITLATTILGIGVLRFAGKGRLALIRRVSSDGMSAVEAGIEANPDGFLVLLGGLLLVLPGFITDVIGVILLIGPLRRWIGMALRRAFGVAKPANGVVDLAADEWQEVPNHKIENRDDRPHGR